MKSLVITALLGLMVFGNVPQEPSTTAAVTLVGGIVKTTHGDSVQKKYKRKDCPVCKGKGWYISGDGISKVNCGYCEDDNKKETTVPVAQVPVVECPEDNCPTPAYVPQPIKKQSVPYRSTTPRRILRRW